MAGGGGLGGWGARDATARSTYHYPAGGSAPPPPAPPRRGPAPRSRDGKLRGKGATGEDRTRPGTGQSPESSAAGSRAVSTARGTPKPPWDGRTRSRWPSRLLPRAPPPRPTDRPRSSPEPRSNRAAAEDGSRGFVLTLPSKLFSSTSLMVARSSRELKEGQSLGSRADGLVTPRSGVWGGGRATATTAGALHSHSLARSGKMAPAAPQTSWCPRRPTSGGGPL